MIKNSEKEKRVYSACGIAFNGKGRWNFGNDFARNAAIFGVDNNSTSFADNWKKNFLALDEVSIYGILMEVLVHQRKS